MKQLVSIISKNWLLFLLFFSALLIRLVSLNQSLWLDEATTARVVQQFDYRQIVSVFSPHDFHPPFYYLFMKFWTGLFGYSEISLRFPSIIASLVTGWLVYKIVLRSIKSVRSVKSTAVWAAAFFLFNPLVVYYSQEARMYAFATLFITIIYWSVAKKFQAHKVRKVIKSLIIGNLFIFLSLVTFYGTVFFVIALYLYLLIKKEYRTLIYLLPGALMAGLLLSPLFLTQLKNSGEVLKQIPNWSLTLGKANLKNLLLIPIKFTSGRISWEPKLIYYLIAGSWALFIFSLLSFSRMRESKTGSPIRSGMTRMLYFFTFPIVLGFVVSFYKPLLQYFRFIYVIPFMCILLAIAADKRWHRAILLAGFITFSLIYTHIPSFHREDWKSMVRSLPSGTVCALPSSFDPIHYYNPKIVTSDLRSCATGKQITVVPYAEEIYGVNHVALLTQQQYGLTKEVSFRGLKYELWSKK